MNAVHRWFAAAVIAMALASAPSVGAHPSIEARLEELTRLIAAAPTDASLLVERAGVHREHGDTPAARRDLDAARALDPQLAGLDLEIGLLLSEQGDQQGAMQALDRAVARDPGDIAALVARGRCLEALGQPERAAADFGLAIAAVPSGVRPQPDLYIEHARLLQLIQPDPSHAHAEAALVTLTDGIARLGPILTLTLPTIELETRLGRYDAALARLEWTPIAKLQRLVMRGEILATAGRSADARAAFSDARQELARVGRRPTPLDEPLRLRIDRGLATP